MTGTSDGSDGGAIRCDRCPPHIILSVDIFDTGVRAERSLRTIISEGTRPVTVGITIPALVRADELIMDTPSLCECITLAYRIEASSEALSAGVLWKNSFTEVAELQMNALVSYGTKRIFRTIPSDHVNPSLLEASLKSRFRESASTAKSDWWRK
ncbi:MAG: hypothetical protein NTW75_00765 [Planctomycetales bacterium]|nr:hypothetical protein [Planctomycetales bacterium]